MFEIEGQYSDAEQAIRTAPSPRVRKRRADQSSDVGQVQRAEEATAAAPSSLDTHQPAEGQINGAEEAMRTPPSPVDTIVQQLVALQRQRRFAIKSQSRIDRSCEAYLAQLAGYRPKTNPDGTRATDAAGKPVQDKAGKALWAEIGRVRRAVERGDNGPFPAWADADLIRISAQSRDAWDAMRAGVEKQMERLAKTLPVYPWWSEIRGAGAKGLAIIVGEAGDLGSYRDKSALWKRLGLAVIDGERQRRVGGDAATVHGFNPVRRAEIWTIADSMFRAQWRGADEETGRAAGPIGPYGEKYAHRRAGTANREGWTPARQNADAKRYMTKSLIRDLRAAWRASQEPA